MKKIRFECESITPMFMAGADGKTPELRPSEFKGVMRFWWRAIKAGSDIEKLRKEEAEIFGGTGEGEGKSKIRLLIKGEDLQIGNNLKNEYSLKWNYDSKTRSIKGEDAGIGYLLYSTVLPSRERQYIKVNSTFVLQISAVDEKFLKQALASLWLAIYLGGFGTRARRGGGDIRVVKIDNTPPESPDFITKGENTDEVANWLITNFKKASQIILGKEQPEKFATSYSNLSFSRFIISNKNFDTWKNSLNDIGNTFKSFREKNRSQIFDSAIFGLPVMHRNCRVVATCEERRASPVIFKIIKSQNKYFWLALRLSGEFLPPRYSIRIESR